VIRKEVMTLKPKEKMPVKIRPRYLRRLILRMLSRYEDERNNQLLKEKENGFKKAT